jgi:Fe-S-cluster-containing hydrogenase component 2
MGFDGEARKVIKCDYCDGDPLCAKLCTYGALRYVDAGEPSMTRSLEVAEKLREMFLGQKTRNEPGEGG